MGKLGSSSDDQHAHFLLEVVDFVLQVALLSVEMDFNEEIEIIFPLTVMHGLILVNKAHVLQCKSLVFIFRFLLIQFLQLCSSHAYNWVECASTGHVETTFGVRMKLFCQIRFGAKMDFKYIRFNN